MLCLCEFVTAVTLTAMFYTTVSTYLCLWLEVSSHYLLYLCVCWDTLRTFLFVFVDHVFLLHIQLALHFPVHLCVLHVQEMSFVCESCPSVRTVHQVIRMNLK